MSAGYSQRGIGARLGFRAGTRLCVIDPPRDYRAIVSDLPAGVEQVGESAARADAVHLFTRQRAGLTERLQQLREVIAPAGMIWVSWPKRASKVETDVTEDVVRAAGLAAGLVDVKVCAVDEVWSGLKLVIRLRDRS